MTGTLQARMGMVPDLLGEVGKHTSCGIVPHQCLSVYKHCLEYMLNHRLLSATLRHSDLQGLSPALVF